MSDIYSDSQQSSSTAFEESSLSKLSFSVKAAIDGRFFRPASTGARLLEEIASNSINVICIKCERKMPNKLKELKVNIKSTSNMYIHIRRYHDYADELEFKKSMETVRDDFVLANPRQARVTRSRRGSSTFTPQARFEELILIYIINTMIPLKSVDDPSFNSIFNFLNIEKDGLRLISRRTLGRRIDEKFLSHVKLLKDMLERVRHVCTTADLWSGRKRSFLGVTCHWLDEKNERKSAALACRRFKGRHTYDKVANLLKSVHQSFGIEQKILGTVTDNGSNFVKAFGVFGVNVEPEVESDVDEEEDWTSLNNEITDRLPNHLRCGAHTLALTSTSDVLKVIKLDQVLNEVHGDTVEKCNNLWKMSNRPRTAEIIQEVLGKSLSRPNATRWNSLYDAFRQIVSFRPCMARLCEALGIESSLNERNFDYLNEYVLCSAPVAEAIDLLQGERTAYYGILLPTLLALNKKLKTLQTNSELQFCAPIVQGYIESIEQRFSSILNFASLEGKNAAIAAISYPKFKSKFFPCIDPATQGEMLQHFKTLIYNYLLNELGENESNTEMEMDVDPPLEDFYDFGNESIDLPQAPQDDLVSMAKQIMDKFLSEKGCGLEILKNYPSINAIFKEKNTPVPSSAQVERLFSFASISDAPRSSRLCDEKFEQRVILRANALLIPINAIVDVDEEDFDE